MHEIGADTLLGQLDIAAALTRANFGLQLGGVLVLLLSAATLVRNGRCTRPVERIPPSAGPDLGTALILSVAYLLLAAAFIVGLEVTAGAIRGLSQPADSVPASPARLHAYLWADAGAKLLVVPFILAALSTLQGDSPRQRLGPGSVLAWVLGALLACVLLCDVLTNAAMAAVELFPQLSTSEHEVIDALRKDPLPPWGALHLAFHAIVIAPFLEELYFRGLVFVVAWRLTQSGWLAVLLSALAFGAVHWTVPHSLPGLIVMGLVLGTVRLAAGSLLSCVLIHALFNARTVAYVLFGPPEPL